MTDHKPVSVKLCNLVTNASINVLFRTQPSLQSDGNNSEEAQQQQQEQQQQQISMNEQVTATNISMSNGSLIAKSALQHACLTFKAGQLKNYVHNWEILSSDSIFLDAIKNYHIELEAECPKQRKMPKQIVFSHRILIEIIESEISKYISKQTRCSTQH
jgi:hypothetical protein